MSSDRVIRRVCVYCASSRSCAPEYHEAAFDLGQRLAREGITLVYGGGSLGSMGALADGALSAAGQVIGVIPDFMRELEWEHGGLSELRVVEDMRTRKHVMLKDSDAVVALPGGSGTFEELFEAISLKRLGIFLGPIVLVDTRGFFQRFRALFDHCIEERMMGERHAGIWTMVDEPSQVLEAIADAPQWDETAREFSAV